MAHDATTAQEVQFTALRYVAQKLFIALVTQFQCVKVILFLIRCITKSDFYLNYTKFILHRRLHAKG